MLKPFGQPGQTTSNAMGNLCAPELELDCQLACAGHVHTCKYPMYLVKVSDFLLMSGTPQPNHVLAERGLLHKWQPGMFTIFVSHQWLGAGHPDETGRQLEVLREAVRRLINGKLQVEVDVTSATPLSRLTPFNSNRKVSRRTRQQIASGFMFLDWWAIPQITARQHGVNETETRSEAALAVQSIPAYVEAADLFLALVPELVHASTGLPCDYASWLSRGWCRAELWCRLLSNKRETSVVVIHSSQEAEIMFPLDWQRNLIADGCFTVEGDRSTVVKLGEVAMASKLQCLREKGPLSHYRFHMAQQPKLLGREREHFNEEAFLQFFNFSSIEDALTDQSGVNGLFCAVLSGNVAMIRLLAENKADVNRGLPDLSELGFYETQTMLMAAAKSHQDPSVLSALIECKAEVSARSRSGVTASFLARSAGQVHALVNARADLAEMNALNGAAGRANTETVKAILDLKIHPEFQRNGKYGTLHSIALWGRGNPDAISNARLLLSHRADANRVARPNYEILLDCAVCSAHLAPQ
ncbi:unnamed protein product [Effrenium voratum]|nr:unnamed protein product [Effrenium voratum]